MAEKHGGPSAPSKEAQIAAELGLVMHTPPGEPMLQFFRFSHLPEGLKAISMPFAVLAVQMASVLPRNPERTAMLRKLLEAKDCAVRAELYE